VCSSDLDAWKARHPDENSRSGPKKVITFQKAGSY
jgi:hypothetical protein